MFDLDRFNDLQYVKLLSGEFDNMIDAVNNSTFDLFKASEHYIGTITRVALDTSSAIGEIALQTATSAAETITAGGNAAGGALRNAAGKINAAADEIRSASFRTSGGNDHHMLIYDKGGIKGGVASGIGAFKATKEDEWIFGPKHTAKMADITKNKQFEVVEDAITFITESPRIAMLESLAEKFRQMNQQNFSAVNNMLDSMSRNMQAMSSNSINNINNNQRTQGATINNYNLQHQGIIEKLDPNENMAELFARFTPLYSGR
jgi:hypothetical protein